MVYLRMSTYASFGALTRRTAVGGDLEHKRTAMFGTPDEDVRNAACVVVANALWLDGVGDVAAALVATIETMMGSGEDEARNSVRGELRHRLACLATARVALTTALGPEMHREPLNVDAVLEALRAAPSIGPLLVATAAPPLPLDVARQTAAALSKKHGFVQVYWNFLIGLAGFESTGTHARTFAFPFTMLMYQAGGIPDALRAALQVNFDSVNAETGRLVRDAIMDEEYNWFSDVNEDSDGEESSSSSESERTGDWMSEVEDEESEEDEDEEEDEEETQV